MSRKRNAKQRKAELDLELLCDVRGITLEELKAELEAIDKANEADHRVQEEWCAIEQRTTQKLEPYIGKPLTPGTPEHDEMELIFAEARNERHAWMKKHVPP